MKQRQLTNSSFLAKLSALSLLLCLLAGQTVSALETIIEYPIPDNATGVVGGADGNVWFTEGNSNNIAKITPAGVVTEYSVPTPNSFPSTITSGPDGNMWFIESTANKIGKITPNGVITEYTVPTTFSGYENITSGPDGNLWFTNGPDNISKITPTGIITEYTVPGLFPTDITTGPDGNMWFIDFNASQVVVVTTQGTVIATYAGDPNWEQLTQGPDGNLWITGGGDNTLNKMTVAGIVTPYSVPTAGAYPRGIATGPDGNIWFTEFLADKVGKITPTGVITEYAIPFSSPSNSEFIAAGPNGTMWFNINGARMGVVQGLTIIASGGPSSSPVIPGSGSVGNTSLQPPETGYARVATDGLLFALTAITPLSAFAAFYLYRRNRQVERVAAQRP